jgi:hypothetical protein
LGGTVSEFVYKAVAEYKQSVDTVSKKQCRKKKSEILDQRRNLTGTQTKREP